MIRDLSLFVPVVLQYYRTANARVYIFVPPLHFLPLELILLPGRSWRKTDFICIKMSSLQPLFSKAFIEKGKHLHSFCEELSLVRLMVAACE